MLRVSPVEPQGPGSGVLKADVRCRSKHLASQPVGAVPPMKMVACGGARLWKGLDWRSLGSLFRKHLWAESLKVSPVHVQLPPSPPPPLSPSILPVDSSTGSSLQVAGSSAAG